MKRVRTAVILFALLVIAIPAFAKENRSGVGVAYTAGVVSVDFPGVPDLDFVGYTVFWKYGFTDMWGLLVSYRDMQDDENFAPGDEIDYTQIGVHAVVMWRHGKMVRPHVKFGLADTDFEVTEASLGSVSESDTAFSIGGGLEAGSERFAFYADYDFTQADLSGVDFDVAGLNLGIVFKY